MQRIVTVPNFITVARGVFGFLGIVIATQPDMFLIGSVIFFLFGMMPDLLDGYFARRLDQCSRLGEFLDPFVDKLLFYGAIFSAFLEYVWLPALIVLCVCDSVSTVLHFTKSGGAVMSGKKKFVLQCVSLGLFCAGILINNVFIAFANIALLLATAYAISSLIQRFKI